MGNQLPVRYRINALSPEDQKYLRDILNQDNTGRLLDQVEQTGKIPDEVVKAYSGLGTGSQYVLNRLQDVISRLPSATTAKTNYLKNNLSDTPNLGDAQLQEKKQLLTDLNKPTNNDPADLKSYFKANIASKIEPYFGKLTSDQLDSLVNYSVDSLHQGNFSNQGVVDRIISFVGKGIENKEGGISGTVFGNRSDGENIGIARNIAEDIRKDYYRETGSGKYEGSTTPADPGIGVDLTSVNSIIADRAKKAELEAAYNDFANSAPGQLASDRQAFFDAQRVRAKDYVTGEYAPQVAQRLNAMGLGDSGEVGAAIASKYSDLLGGVDASQLNQLQADTQFFGQQAYQKTFQDLIAARTDVSGQIANERDVLRTNQARGFASSQADLESRFSLDLFKQQSQAAYNNYQAQVNRQRQMVQDQNNLGNIGAVGQVVGQVAGAYAGSRGGGSSNTGGTNSTGNTGNTATVPNLK